jgi:hypothetical protein
MIFSKVVVIGLGTVAQVMGDLGGMTINNTLGSDLFIWPVGAELGPMTRLHPTELFKETWRRRDDGGFSIKIATVPSLEDILQFEYTWNGSTVFWDLSEINMSNQSDFKSVGFSVTIDSSQCPSMMCLPNDLACHEAFQQSSDNWAIRTCDAETNVVLVFKVGL